MDTGALRQAITIDKSQITQGNVYIGVARAKKEKKKK